MKYYVIKNKNNQYIALDTFSGYTKDFRQAILYTSEDKKEMEKDGVELGEDDRWVELEIKEIES